MQSLIEFFPLVAFFAAWALGGIYVATAVLMGAMVLLLAWDWFRTRTLPKMHLISAVLVWVFGGITLILHDVRFIQWKATVFYWAIAVLLAGSVWIGRKTLLERLLVTDVAAERVAGIRGIHDEPALAHDLHGAPDQAQLRILGM